MLADAQQKGSKCPEGGHRKSKTKPAGNQQKVAKRQQVALRLKWPAQVFLYQMIQLDPLLHSVESFIQRKIT